jgi:hypothetical protein
MVLLAFSGGWWPVVSVAGSFAVLALVLSNIPRLRAARRR